LSIIFFKKRELISVIIGEMSHNDSLEERVTRAESQLSFNSSVAKEQRDDIKDIKETVNDIKTSIAVFQNQCLACQSKPNLEPRIRDLESKASIVLGGWKMIMVFVSLGGLILKEFISYIRGH
jgi:uncharacterized coiled-coil protein SlyX